MKLQNEFTVPGRPDEVFELLLDLEQVAGCMPGATLTDRSGDEYQGTLKLRVGPIAAAYEGKLVVDDVDRSSRSATLRGTGRELNGQGGAEALIHATVQDDGAGSRVAVDTDVEIRGKAAQFGRGVLGEVTQRVMDQFAANLEAQLLAGAPTESAAEVPESEPEAARQAAPSAPRSEEALDAVAVVLLPMLRKAAPAAIGVVAGALLGWLLRGRRRRSFGGGPVQPQRSAGAWPAAAPTWPPAPPGWPMSPFPWEYRGPEASDPHDG